MKLKLREKAPLTPEHGAAEVADGAAGEDARDVLDVGVRARLQVEQRGAWDRDAQPLQHTNTVSLVHIIKGKEHRSLLQFPVPVSFSSP